VSRRRYLVCPACDRRGVYLRLRGEDWWVCRYCRYDLDGWRGACNDGNDQPDVEERARLAAVNPDAGPWDGR